MKEQSESKVREKTKKLEFLTSILGNVIMPKLAPDYTGSLLIVQLNCNSDTSMYNSKSELINIVL